MTKIWVIGVVPATTVADPAGWTRELITTSAARMITIAANRAATRTRRFVNLAPSSFQGFRVDGEDSWHDQSPIVSRHSFPSAASHERPKTFVVAQSEQAFRERPRVPGLDQHPRSALLHDL